MAEESIGVTTLRWKGRGFCCVGAANCGGDDADGDGLVFVGVGTRRCC